PMQPPPLPQPAPPRGAEEFCKAVVRSGLLGEAELAAALAPLPPEVRADPVALADALVRTGKLSRFQARKLLSRRSRGLVLGPFQVLSLIGRGGNGTVFLARDSRNGSLVALKVLAVAGAEERVRARFRREMDLARTLDHPHVARAYDAGHLQGVD